VTTRITAGRALLGSSIEHGVVVEIDHGVITSVRPHSGVCDVELLAPGFVDLQVNGIDDVDVATARGADWDRLDQLLLAQGTTTWCPTLVTAPLPAYRARLDAVAETMARTGSRPTIAGVHLEGPFLGGAHGAHRSEYVVDIDLDWVRELPAHVRVLTLGPEQRLAPEATVVLSANGVLVSLGHTTASQRECDDAARAGARMVTHLFNAMSGMHHRQPGVAAWALGHPDIACCLIADGVHVHPRMIELAMRMLGPQRSVLVTDSVAWRSGHAGEVRLAMVDGAPRLPDGTLAGSALTMDAAVRTSVAAGVPLSHALCAASQSPASLLGLTDRGQIAVGRRADLVAMNDALAVRGVWVAGQPVC
jgi:N-acetylglucosamine-6-phosphate deacetylase